METTLLIQALEAARAAMQAAKPARASGCGRVYVTLEGLDRRGRLATTRFAKASGLIFQTRAHYGMRDALYLGYDNATGRQLGQGEAFVAALALHGVAASLEAQAD